MSDATCVPARVDGEPRHITPRAAWRDAIKADRGLSSNAKLYALVLADFWRHDDPAPLLWCSNDVAQQYTGLSTASLTRARRELVERGYLSQEAKAHTGRSARYRPVHQKRATPERGNHTDDLRSSERRPKVITQTTDSLETLEETPNLNLGHLPMTEAANPPKQPLDDVTDAKNFADTMRTWAHLDDDEIPDAYWTLKARGFRFPGAFVDHLARENELDGYIGSHGLTDDDCDLVGAR